MQVYGVPKVWKQMNRESIAGAHGTVAPSITLLGLRGAVRGTRLHTATSAKSAPRPLNRVNRQFKADRPNKLSVRR